MGDSPYELGTCEKCQEADQTNSQSRIGPGIPVLICNSCFRDWIVFSDSLSILAEITYLQEHKDALEQVLDNSNASHDYEDAIRELLEVTRLHAIASRRFNLAAMYWLKDKTSHIPNDPALTMIPVGSLNSKDDDD